MKEKTNEKLRSWRVMSLNLIGLFLASAMMYATQAGILAGTVTIQSGSSIGDVISAIEEQTDNLFVYDKSEVDLNRKVNVNLKDKPVEEALDAVLRNTDITYAIEGNSIVLMKNEARPVAKATLKQQAGKAIRGVVLDEYGESVIGANVSVKGTTNGTITDIDGAFDLNVPEGATLVISYIGYLTQELVITNQTILNIVLKEDTQTLDEVVVVGYGTQKKANLTGAVAQVDSKVFENRPVTTAASALQGTMPGVYINPKSGNPNTDIEFNVRGTTSINGGGPLVLIDGIEGNMSLLNPNDIESVTVLKDAAASSIYGVRAAFGVILVTTKKGTKDQLKITYSGNFSWSKATVMPEFVKNSYTHARFVEDASKRENVTMYDLDYLEKLKEYWDNPKGKQDYYIIQDPKSTEKTYRYLGNRDYIDLLIRNLNPKQSHNLNLSGGSGKTTFYTSIGHTRQEGVLKINPDIYKRTNARLSVENQYYDWMKIGVTTTLNVSNMDEPYKYKDDIYHSVVFSSPLRGGQWFGDKDHKDLDKYIGFYFEDQGPDGYLVHGGRTITKRTEVQISPYIEFYPLKNWRIHLDYSFNKLTTEKTEHAKRIDEFITYKFQPTVGTTGDNSFKVTNNFKEYSSFNAYTDYEFRLKDIHYFKVMAGFNQEVTKYASNESTHFGQLTLDVPALGLGVGEQRVSSSGYEWALRGGFARINYVLADKYMIELNGRYDGTSRFPKDDRFAFTPSFSLGWRLSEEAFMSFTKPLFDNIKLRMSYGKLGNQLLSMSSWKTVQRYYPYIEALTSGTSANYIFGNGIDNLMNPAYLVPASLTWEKSTTINGGIDINMLNNRLDLSLDIYRRTTSDMLIQRTVPELLGASAPPMNAGELRTKGWELAINWRDKIGKDFTYSVGFSLFDAQAEITKYDGPAGAVTDWYVGKKVGEIWGYETLGFFTSDDDVTNSPSQSAINSAKWTAGDIKYANRNDDNVISKGANTVEDPGDQFIIGNETPRYNYGINMNAGYKGIFLSMFFQGVGKRDFFPTGQAFWPVRTQYFNTQKWFVDNSWSEDNPNAYFAIPRARQTKNLQNQTKYLQDASYVRLKNLTVGYTLPKAWVNKVKLSNVQVYFSGENLWENSHIKGPYDPEGMSNKGDMYYPFQRTFSFGLDVTF